MSNHNYNKANSSMNLCNQHPVVSFEGAHYHVRVVVRVCNSVISPAERSRGVGWRRWGKTHGLEHVHCDQFYCWRWSFPSRTGNWKTLITSYTKSEHRHIILLYYIIVFLPYCCSSRRVCLCVMANNNDSSSSLFFILVIIDNCSYFTPIILLLLLLLYIKVRYSCFYIIVYYYYTQ